MRAIAALTAILALVPAMTQADPPPPPYVGGSLCSEATKSAEKPAPAVAILSGQGAARMAIQTNSAKAQAFFDNGLQLGHAFGHGDAVAAFEEAARLDPNCAMCLWGQAWAGGATINFPADKKTQERMAELMKKATVLAQGGPERERRLIAAMTLRYQHGGGKGSGDLAYAKAMDQLAAENPDDVELAVLAADALMVTASLKNNMAVMPRAMTLLEGALKRSPDDAGAIHFYIHASEMSAVTAKAEPYADKLGGIAPAAGHLIHMPSHTFYWVGRYRDALTANAAAARADEARTRAMGKATTADFYENPYHAHNVQFGAAGGMMSGDGAGAIAITSDILPMAMAAPAKTAPQRLSAVAYAALGRYGDPETVLALVDPGADKPFMRAMRAYARGEALARKGDAAGVRREALAMNFGAGDFKAMGQGAKRAASLTKMARLVLEGRAAMLENNPKAAAKAFNQAAALDESHFKDFTDPPAWWYPVRRSEAAALLASGDAAGAAETARKALAQRPIDPISLSVLSQAERKLGQTESADKHLAQARKGWVGDVAVVSLAAS